MYIHVTYPKGVTYIPEWSVNLAIRYMYWLDSNPRMSIAILVTFCHINSKPCHCFYPKQAALTVEASRTREQDTVTLFRYSVLPLETESCPDQGIYNYYQCETIMF